MEPRKSVFFTMVNSRRFGTGPNTALSMDKDWAPLENVFSSTLVRLYRASGPLARVALCDKGILGSVFTRLTNSQASRNLKTVFESASFLSSRNSTWPSWIRPAFWRRGAERLWASISPQSYRLRRLYWFRSKHIEIGNRGHSIGRHGDKNATDIY